jgi:hypothetical protein
MPVGAHSRDNADVALGVASQQLPHQGCTGRRNSVVSTAISGVGLMPR